MKPIKGSVNYRSETTGKSGPCLILTEFTPRSHNEDPELLARMVLQAERTHNTF